MSSDFTVQWKSSMDEIDKDAWNRLTAANETPFYDWDWLRLLESSGSIQPENGWTPVHGTVWSGSRLVACAPLYVKTHSMGEFVYDFAWADVAAQLNIDYYPKLVGTCPATPSGSYSLFCDPDYPQAAELLYIRIMGLAKERRYGGVSFLFVNGDWVPEMTAKGFGEWKHQSYLWTNRGFASFDDYLALFSKGQRRNIRRETASMESQGIAIRPLWIEDSNPEQRRFLYEMYDNTNSQFGPWAARFLTPSFFFRLHEIGGRRILLFLAEETVTGAPVAVSLLVVKGERMFGRYWGTRSFVKNLHFVLCYYEPIRYAIEHGISYFDPGAGSPHKLRRGFEAVPVSSLHWFSDPMMNRVFSTYMPKINTEEEQTIDIMNSQVPLSPRKTDWFEK